MQTVKKVCKAVFFMPLAIISGLVDYSGSLILMDKDRRQDRDDDAYRRMEGIR